MINALTFICAAAQDYYQKQVTSSVHYNIMDIDNNKTIESIVDALPKYLHGDYVVPDDLYQLIDKEIEQLRVSVFEKNITNENLPAWMGVCIKYDCDVETISDIGEISDKLIESVIVFIKRFHINEYFDHCDLVKSTYPDANLDCVDEVIKVQLFILSAIPQLRVNGTQVIGITESGHRISMTLKIDDATWLLGCKVTVVGVYQKSISSYRNDMQSYIKNPSIASIDSVGTPAAILY